MSPLSFIPRLFSSKKAKDIHDSTKSEWSVRNASLSVSGKTVPILSPECVDVIMLDGKTGILPAEQHIIERREQRNAGRIRSWLSSQEIDNNL